MYIIGQWLTGNGDRNDAGVGAGYVGSATRWC